MRAYRVLACVIAAAVLAAGMAPAQAAVSTRKPARITVQKRGWHGYGFLPGYRPWVNGLDRQGRAMQRPERPEPRYLNLYSGQWNYGWGDPGFYRGRWNGGGFGPCWTYTPIGMMPTC